MLKKKPALKASTSFLGHVSQKKPASLKGSSEDHDDSEDELKKEDITFGGGGGGGGSGRDASSSRAASSRSRGPPPFERSISLTPGALLSREGLANSSSTTAAGILLLRLQLRLEQRNESVVAKFSGILVNSVVL